MGSYLVVRASIVRALRMHHRTATDGSASWLGRRRHHSPPRRPRQAYHLAVGIRRYLIEGVFGTGKTSACKELQRRGYHAINGDNELAYQGDPETGIRTGRHTHEQHIWYVDKVKTIVASRDEAVIFFYGGSKNFSKFINLFDGVFVLEVDLDTLNRRIYERCRLDPDDWGEDQANGNSLCERIDATAPLARVVEEILRQSARAGKDAVHRNR
jgi:broad-specificity NMP kinase